MSVEGRRTLIIKALQLTMSFGNLGAARATGNELVLASHDGKTGNFLGLRTG